MLKIVQVPHKVLATPTQPVKKVDAKIRKLVFDMEETLIAQIDPQGVGLAAPRVGINLSLFIMRPTLKSDTIVCINPKILKTVGSSQSTVDSKNKLQTNNEDGDTTKLEGCLSIPRIWGPVKRPEKVLLEYQDLTGEKHTKWFSGFKAIIIQHEVDHLQGILFTQRVLEQKNPLYQEKEGELEKMEY